VLAAGCGLLRGLRLDLRFDRSYECGQAQGSICRGQGRPRLCAS
jgi:hypothetical protein